MMGASKLDRRIIVERYTETGRDPFNDPIMGWAPITTISAKRHDVSDVEKFAAGQIGAAISSRFIVRDHGEASTVSPVDRLSHDGKTWNITGIKETRDGRHRFIEISATAVL